MVVLYAKHRRTMQLQSILRHVHRIPGFVYGSIELQHLGCGPSLVVQLRPRRGSRPTCSGCGRRGRGYDTLKERRFDFVPLWAIPVVFVYAMRRVDCTRCGVTVEMVPWATGKSPLTHAYCWFLASWAKTLSWRETARRFQASWDTVFRAVETAVRWGLAHRDLDDVRAIGVDELSWKKGQRYLTMVYQLDHGCRRLLHISKDRTTASFNSFFDMLGDERTRHIEFVASDMWQAFLNVIRARCSDAIHVLDRFHVMQLMSKAIDETRREEVRRLRAKGKHDILKNTRWLFLKRPEKFNDAQRGRLRELLAYNLRSVRAFLLKQDFQHFWDYKAPWAAKAFLHQWTKQAMCSKLEPMKRFARTVRQHEPELLNWFKARGRFALGATEGFNNKARITTRKAYGFRTYEHAEIALYHALGDLPEPDWITHRFS